MGSINIIKPQPTVLSSAVNLPQQLQNFLRKFFGNAGIRTRGHWVGNKYAIHCAMCPLPALNHCEYFVLDIYLCNLFWCPKSGKLPVYVN